MPSKSGAHLLGRFSLLLLLAVPAIAVAANATYYDLASADDCSSITTCSACTGSCAWCIGSSSCQVATRSCTCSGDCDEGSSDCYATVCPAVHQCQYADCGACTADPACGWNIYSASCSPGNAKSSCWSSWSSRCSGSARGEAGFWWRYGADALCPRVKGCDYGNCSACTADPACGWNGQNNQCSPGNAIGSCFSSNDDQCSGPAKNAGPKAYWHFGPNATCPKVKQCQYADCGACTADPACGWNIYSASCSVGNSFGSCWSGWSSRCSGSARGEAGFWWRYGADALCPRVKGCDYGNCSACTADPACGWNGQNNQCSPGNAIGSCFSSNDDQCSGPARHAGPKAYWHFGPNATCPKVKQCQYADCGSCTADPACGWNIYTSSCSVGNSFGSCWNSWSSTCSGSAKEEPGFWWRYGADALCPRVKRCDYDDCSACTADPACGWSTYEATCSPGNQYGSCWSSSEGRCSGPARDSEHSSWQYIGWATCPDNSGTCSQHSDCISCTYDPACGWNGQACTPGTTLGACYSSWSRSVWYFHPWRCPGSTIPTPTHPATPSATHSPGTSTATHTASVSESRSATVTATSTASDTLTPPPTHSKSHSLSSSGSLSFPTRSSSQTPPPTVSRSWSRSISTSGRTPSHVPTRTLRPSSTISEPSSLTESTALSASTTQTRTVKLTPTSSDAETLTPADVSPTVTAEATDSVLESGSRSIPVTVSSTLMGTVSPSHTVVVAHRSVFAVVNTSVTMSITAFDLMVSRTSASIEQRGPRLPWGGPPAMQQVRIMYAGPAAASAQTWLMGGSIWAEAGIVSATTTTWPATKPAEVRLTVDPYGVTSTYAQYVALLRRELTVPGLGGEEISLVGLNQSTWGTSVNVTVVIRFHGFYGASAASHLRKLDTSGKQHLGIRRVWPAATSNDDGGGDGSGGGGSAGVVAGAVIACLVVAIAVAVVMFVRRRRRQRDGAEYPNGHSRLDSTRSVRTGVTGQAPHEMYQGALPTMQRMLLDDSDHQGAIELEETQARIRAESRIGGGGGYIQMT